MIIPSTFKSNFDSVLTTVSTNPLYVDIKKWLTDGLIDKKTFEQLMLGFHKVVLPEALATAKELILSMQEVEVDNKKYTLQKVQILEASEKVALAETQNLAELEKVEFIKAQTESETERKLLLETQKNGFLDNRVIKMVGEIRGLVGEIEAGGLENPAENWALLYSSLGALAQIANEHPQVTTDITVPSAPNQGA